MIPVISHKQQTENSLIHCISSTDNSKTHHSVIELPPVLPSILLPPKVPLPTVYQSHHLVRTSPTKSSIDPINVNVSTIGMPIIHHTDEKQSNLVDEIMRCYPNNQYTRSTRETNNPKRNHQDLARSTSDSCVEIKTKPPIMIDDMMATHQRYDTLHDAEHDPPLMPLCNFYDTPNGAEADTEAESPLESPNQLDLSVSTPVLTLPKVFANKNMPSVKNTNAKPPIPPPITKPDLSDVHYSVFVNRLSIILNIPIYKILKIGHGTYSYVFAIPEGRVIKVYRNKYAFRKKYITDPQFFKDASFREIFFNKIMNHQNTFKYDSINYDDEIGIYQIGARMDGTLADTQIHNCFNEDMFYTVLTDIVSAIKYLHSHGLAHSDIKPSNILYKINPNTSLVIFMLTDFNLIQFCSSNDNQNTFATPNFSCSEKRTMMIDIYMLGASLLWVIMKVHNIDISNDQINSDVLRNYKLKVINVVGRSCYDILHLMLAPLDHRIYIDHLEVLISKRPETTDTYKVICQYVNLLSHLRSSGNHMQLNKTIAETYGHDFHKLNWGFYSVPSDTIYNTGPDGKIDITSKDNNLSVLQKGIADIIDREFDIPASQRDISGFIADSIVYYPRMYNLPSIIRTVSDLVTANQLFLRIIMSGIKINCHRVSCIECHLFDSIRNIEADLQDIKIKIITDNKDHQREEMIDVKLEDGDKSIFSEI